MTTTRTLSPGDTAGQGSSASSATRDKLADRLRRIDRDAPDALDLLALAMDATADQLRGVAGLLAGPRGADHFRRVLRGEEAGFSAEIARLALDPRREARAAVRAYLEVMAAAVGCHLEITAAPTVDIGEAHAGKIEADARLDAELIRANADGVIDADEAVRLKRALAEADARRDRLRAAIAQAEAKALGRPMATGR